MSVRSGVWAAVLTALAVAVRAHGAVRITTPASVAATPSRSAAMV